MTHPTSKSEQAVSPAQLAARMGAGESEKAKNEFAAAVSEQLESLAELELDAKPVAYSSAYETLRDHLESADKT